MSIFGDLYAGLTGRGFTSEQSAGIAAGIIAESGGNPNIWNGQGSGAYGIGQWLGTRRTALFSRYGNNPTRDQQLDFLASELRGGDAGGRFVLAASGSQNVLTAYITRFMRPRAGAETTGDLQRGTRVLQTYSQAVASQASGGTFGDWIHSTFGDTAGQISNGIGTALAAPGDAIDGAVNSAEQSLFGEWFQRIGFALLAILLIGVALFMLAEKPVKEVISNLPPVVPV